MVLALYYYNSLGGAEMSDKSKTQIVKEYIEGEIKAGRITNGQRLPSCREVSAKLGVNKITVNKAYTQLEAEHRLYSIPRGGFYLVEYRESHTAADITVDFRTVKPDDRLIPYREFTHVINRAVDTYKDSLFGYEKSIGLESLRHVLKEEFEKDGVYTSADNIIVTNGAQQGINLAFQTVFSGCKGKLLVEIPTYDLAMKMADHLGIKMEGIERQEEGYDFKKLEMVFKRGDIAAFYVIPRHHNPTGYSLSEHDKRKLAELCSKYKVIIIEDDYLADLGTKKGTMPIHYYDLEKKTIYIRSFSKTFMPGIRLGAVILSPNMTEKMAEIKYLTDINTSNIPQAALESFIRSGMYGKHIQRVRKSYENKLKKARDIFISLCPEEMYYYIPEHGIYIWIELLEGVKAALVFKRLEEDNITVRTTEEFFLSNYSGREFIRLCISGVHEDMLNKLARVIKCISDISRDNLNSASFTGKQGDLHAD